MFRFTFQLLLLLIVNNLVFAQAPLAFKSLDYGNLEIQNIQLPESQVQLAYTEKGSGKKTLIFVHGLGSYLPVWKKNIDLLSEKYNCVAVDLPGYGLSEKSDKFPYSMTFFAQVLAEFIKEKNYKNIYVIGHSMGGQISIRLALLHSNLLDGLILLAPAGLETFTEQESQMMQSFTKPEQIMATSESQIEKNLKNNFYQFPDDAQFMIVDRKNMMKEEEAFSAYCTAVSQAIMGMLNEPIADNLSQIELPTLLLFGEEDALIPNKLLHPTLSRAEMVEEFLEILPNAEFKSIPEAGHLLQFEQSEKVNAAIIEFLN